MTVSKAIYAGVDVGASRTKVAVLNKDRNLLGYCIKKSGTDFTATADACLESSLNMAGAAASEIVKSVSTGYGRKNVSFSDETKTEIGCHAKGCFLYFPMAITIIDIGGESTRPGADFIPEDIEVSRTAPIIAALRETSDIAISIDTRKASVAQAALAAGADLVVVELDEHLLPALADVLAGQEGGAHVEVVHAERPDAFLEAVEPFLTALR